MGLADIVRSAVKIANNVTGGPTGLQATVQHGAWPGQSGDGTPLSEPVLVTRRALVDWKQERVTRRDGQEAISRVYVAFLEPVTVTDFDTIILPDGSTGPILSVSGFVDAGTGRPYYAEVWIG